MAGIDRVQELIDKQDIADALPRYCRGVDRADGEVLSSVYHPDSFDDHGYFKGTGPEFVRWVIPRLQASPALTQHVISNILIELEGDAAHVETYFISYRGHDHDQDRRLEALAGRYIDQFERRNGTWRIARRTVVCDWANVSADGEAFPGREAFVAGRHDRADVSYVK